MEPVEAFRQVIEQRALDLDDVREFGREPLRVVAGIGAGALREKHPHVRARALPLGCSGERGRRNLIGGEAGVGCAPEHLGDEPGKRFGTTPLGRPIGHVRPGAVAARDIAGIGQPSVDRPNGVRVDAQGGTQFADREQSRAGQQPAGVDLVRELPVDLGRNRDVRAALDVQITTHDRGLIPDRFVH